MVINESILDWLGWSICLLYICIVLGLAVGVAVCKTSVLWLTGEDLCWIALWYANIFDVAVFNASMLVKLNWEVHLPSIYMHCPRSSSGCSSMQGIYAQMTGGSIFPLYICIVLDLAVGVAGMQDIYAQMSGGSICLQYIDIVLDIAVGVVVCKISMLEWLGVHLPSIYMHCPTSISGFSIIQGIYAWLTGKGHMKCNGIQGIYTLLTGWSICLLYIGIVLDLAVGVVVCKASVLNWLGGHLSSIYMHCPRSSSGCSGMQDI